MHRATIRVDASHVIGSGHVIRCLTLAEVLRERAVQVSFICRELDGNLCDLIESRGFPVTRLPLDEYADVGAAPPEHAAWLRSSWQTDAAQTRSAIEASGGTDWLVIDHYALDWRWEEALGALAGEIVVIDDLADRNHRCRTLLDQNLVDGMADRYEARVPPATGLLLGPRYALLQPLYARLHAEATARKGPVSRLLVYFGGSDLNDLTGRTLAAFRRLNRTDIEVDLVIANGSPHMASICRQTDGLGNVHIHQGLPSLAEIMARADIAIGAGGATVWERLCLGLPSLVVTIAENQRSIAEELHRRALIRYLGHHDTVDVSDLERVLADVLGRDSDEQWSQRCLAVVDGAGAARVAAVLTADPDTPLRVRPADESDESLLLEWANDRLTRRNAFFPEPISASTHRAWFRVRVADPGRCRMYIVETGEAVPVGTVRFEHSIEGWEVHFSLAPSFRGRGLGRKLLQSAMRALRTDTIRPDLIFGQVRAENIASRRIFEGLCFEGPTDARDGVVVYRRAK